MKKVTIIFILFIVAFSTCFAHGDISKRINHKTEEIKVDPRNPELYLERGFLYLQHEEYDKAIEDYLVSEKLGYSSKLLYYRKSEAFFKNKEYREALESIDVCLSFDALDVKSKKLLAQIQFQLGQIEFALTSYQFVIDRTLDLKPEDIIEYSEFILALDPKNYKDAVKAIDAGLSKLGEQTFSLQLKKLEYFEASQQIENVIEQYNYFILNTKRKENWYYRKAFYLFENGQIDPAKIALEQAKMSLSLLDQKFKNTSSIKNLQNNIKSLESKLNL